MCVYIYIFMFICVYICVCMYIIYIYIYIYVCVYMYGYICIFMFICVYILYFYMCVYVYINIYIYSLVRLWIIQLIQSKISMPAAALWGNLTFPHTFWYYLQRYSCKQWGLLTITIVTPRDGLRLVAHLLIREASWLKTAGWSYRCRPLDPKVSPKQFGRGINKQRKRVYVIWTDSSVHRRLGALSWSPFISTRSVH